MEIIKITDKEKEYIVNDILAINKAWYEKVDSLKKGENKDGEN